nr:hypothetical protein [Tanacetum cinerariifolium]
EKIDSPFQQTSSLKPYVSNAILEKIIIYLEDEVVSFLDKEKANLKTIDSLKSKGFESSENTISKTENQSENDCQVVEKECDKVENPKVIAPGMFKLSVSQSVSPFSISKTSCDYKNVERCSNHMMGNRTRLKNFVEKFLGTVRFGNNDFVVIVGYGDVLWHQRLSHLNFATINNHVKNILVQGHPKMKFEKYHLCSACEQGKIHRKHHNSKMVFASNKPLYLLYMDLCGPMRVRVRTDNGTEFKNKTLAKFFDEVGITQQFSATRTPQQNGVVERRTRTLVEAARTMLTFQTYHCFYGLKPSQ